jgi:hypothetical protein
MKDYTLHKADQNKFILRYYRAEDRIIVEYADGTTWKYEDTEENEATIQEKMKDQVAKDSKAKGQSCVNGRNLSAVLTGATVVGLGVLGYVNPEIPLYLTGGLAGLTATIGAVKIAKNQSIISDINKHRYFHKNADKLNQTAIANAVLLTGTSRKMKKLVASTEEGQMPFDYNSIEKLSLKDLKTIMANLEKDEYFGLSYKEEDKQPIKQNIKK